MREEDRGRAKEMEREMEREGGLEQSKVEIGAAVWGEMVRRDGEERTEGREGERNTRVQLMKFFSHISI